LVFALQGRKLPIDVFRSTINLVFVVSGAVAMLAFIVTNEVRSEAVAGMVLAVPAMALGICLGLIIRPHINEARARTAVLILLALAGLVSILGAVSSF
jgi:uncharacterized membrane protein YfcA